LNAAVGTQLVALGQLPRIIRSGEHDDRYHAGAGIGPYRSQNLESVQPRQFQIEEYQPGGWLTSAVSVGTAAEQEIEGFLAVPGHLDPSARIELTQRPESELHLKRAVLDQEYVRRRRVNG
jgi:hypothetical protein